VRLLILSLCLSMAFPGSVSPRPAATVDAIEAKPVAKFLVNQMPGYRLREAFRMTKRTGGDGTVYSMCVLTEPPTGRGPFFSADVFRDPHGRMRVLHSEEVLACANDVFTPSAPIARKPR